MPLDDEIRLLERARRAGDCAARAISPAVAAFHHHLGAGFGAEAGRLGRAKPAPGFANQERGRE